MGSAAWAGIARTRPGARARRTAGTRRSCAIGALPHVGNAFGDPRLAIGIGDLLDLGGVFDRIALGIAVVREQIVAVQVTTGSPDAADTTLAGVEDRLQPFVAVLHLESRVVEGRLPIARLAE